MNMKIDIEKVLKTGQAIQIKPIGFSMYPLIVQGRDEVIIEPVDSSVVGSLKRNDVVLYRRDNGRLVLHRIYKVKNKRFYMVGDNQMEIEGPLYEYQIKGIMVAVIRNGRMISTDNFVYVLYSRVWLRLRPLRGTIGKIIHNIKILFQ